ncbi:bacterial transcriptional activator domain-containing protein [Ruminococcaceae bacterium OttesenSCG-928-A16]|nr:bacterial transcriptional activator domain-containing protein [Ruminococcaceae bacterium OttesenSCG-928-A16]
MIKQIKVQTMRGLAVWADGEVVLPFSAKINKPWQLFCLLVANQGKGVPAARIIGALWPDETLADPANALKNAVYSLRRAFPAGRAEDSPVLFEQGSYRCNPAIEFVVDVDEFSKACLLAENATGTKKVPLLEKAVALYTGDYLPQMENENWVMIHALHYKGTYTNNMKTLLALLFEAGEYHEVIAVATNGSRLDPLEETYYLYLFRGMHALDMQRVIVPAYQKLASMFSEQMGASLPQEIQEIYRRASLEANQSEHDIELIRRELEEDAVDKQSPRGPLYCTYDVFKYLYQMMIRMAPRNRDTILVLLLSVHPKTLPEAKQPEQEEQELAAGMALIKKEILAGLVRKSDIMARYSKSQYIFMLVSSKAAGVEVVTQRLHKKMDAMLDKLDLEMVFTTTELDLFKD